MKRVIVLGATGSIGTSVLEVLRAHAEEFRVTGLAAARPGGELAALAREFPEAAVAVADDPEHALQARLAASPRSGAVLTGPEAALDLVRGGGADICVAGISGTAGLLPAFAAAEKGMRILLANKEVLVSAGGLFNAAARAGGAEVLPLDSEHAALWQCLDGRDRAAVAKIWITASGGPFRTWTREQMAAARPADALKHPKWRMGAKISVDSATLANKALEVIEAHQFFGFPPESIGILVHPQSVVHGIVEFADGGQLAHMGVCDMRQPVRSMLLHPERRAGALPGLDLASIGRLDFEAPDYGRFPLLALGLEACRRGGGGTALYNAANEAAVALFLEGKLSFPGIADAVAFAMRGCAPPEPSSLADVAALHAEGARKVREFAIAQPHFS